MKVEDGESKGKEVKRKREDEDVIEVFDDDDLDSLQVLCTTSRGFRIPDEI